MTQFQSILPPAYTNRIEKTLQSLAVAHKNSMARAIVVDIENSKEAQLRSEASAQAEVQDSVTPFVAPQIVENKTVDDIQKEDEQAVVNDKLIEKVVEVACDTQTKTESDNLEENDKISTISDEVSTSPVSPVVIDNKDEKQPTETEFSYTDENLTEMKLLEVKLIAKGLGITVLKKSTKKKLILNILKTQAKLKSKKSKM